MAGRVLAVLIGLLIGFTVATLLEPPRPVAVPGLYPYEPAGGA